MSEITGPNEALPPAIQLDEPPRIPPPTLPPFAEQPPTHAPSLRPVPFEDTEAFPDFWSRVGGMFRLVFSNPMELFDRVPVTEGFGAPWRFLLLMPLFTFLGMAVFGALNHFFLWMWGGLKPGVGAHQSIRAYGYASAFIQIGGLIPYLNILIQLAGLVVIGMGLARMHKTDTWRGVCAVLTPLFLVCCCLVPLAIMAISTFAALGHH